MKKIITTPATGKVTLSVDNAGEIIICAAERDTIEIALEYTDERLKWKESCTDDEYKLHIKNPDNGKSGSLRKTNRTFPFSPSTGFSPIPLQLLGEILSNAGTKIQQPEFPLVKVTINIPESVKKLKLDMNNCTVDFRSGKVTGLIADLNNCKVKIAETLIVPVCNFDMNNCKVSLPYPGEAGKVEISANNSKVKFTKGDCTSFPVWFSGNHIKAQNGFQKSKSAPVSVEGNNVKLKFQLTEEVL